MKVCISMLSVLLLLVSSRLHSQDRFLMGATAGVSRTSLSGDAPENSSYSSRTGFCAGLIGEYSLTADIRLGVQPSYARRGTIVAYDVGEHDPRDSLDLSMDYASIPVVVRFMSRNGFWFVNGGLDLGFLLDASIKNITTGSESNAKNVLNNVDLAMLVGVGGIVQVQPLFLTFELRYSQSLLNAGANDSLTAMAGIPLRFRLSGFQLLAGILIPL